MSKDKKEREGFDTGRFRDERDGVRPTAYPGIKRRGVSVDSSDYSKRKAICRPGVVRSPSQFLQRE